MRPEPRILAPLGKVANRYKESAISGSNLVSLPGDDAAVIPGEEVARGGQAAHGDEVWLGEDVAFRFSDESPLVIKIASC